MIDLRRCAAAALVLAAPVLLAAGCSKANRSASQVAAASGAGAMAAAAGGGDAARDEATGPMLTPDKLPVIKAGLWKITRTSEGKTATDQDCQSGKRMKPISMGKACSSLSAHRTLLGGFVMDASCAMSGVTMKMHVKASGDWNSHYSVDTSTDMKMPGQPEQIRSEHTEAVWAGACPAGMEPAEQ